MSAQWLPKKYVKKVYKYVRLLAMNLGGIMSKKQRQRSWLAIVVLAVFASTLQVGPALAANSCPDVSKFHFYEDFSNQNLSGCNLEGFMALGSDFTGADLHGASLVSANINSANLTGANLAGALLRYGNLGDSNLTNVDLSGANLNFANLASSNLTGANLSGANLTQAIATNADLSNADFTGATLTGIKAKFTKDEPKALPDPWVSLNKFLVGPGAVLDEADFSGADITGLDLATTKFWKVTSGGVTGTPKSLPKGWVLKYGYLLGPTANLTNADFSNKDLSNLDLHGAAFTNANLTNTTMNNVDVTNASFYKSDLSTVISSNLTPAEDNYADGWRIVGGKFMFKQEFARNLSPWVTGAAEIGGVYTAHTLPWDEPATYTYQWSRDYKAIPGATGSTYSITPADVDHIIGVVVTAAADGFWGKKEYAGAPTPQVTFYVPNPTAPTILGDPIVGVRLKASITGWPAGSTFTYQWFRDDVPIEGARNSGYTVSTYDLKHFIKVTIYGGVTGYLETSTTSESKLVDLVNAKSGTVKITGTPKFGNTLKATATGWVRGAKLRYEWFLNGRTIAIESKGIFKVSKFYKPRTIYVVVTQTIPGYLPATATSNTLKFK